MGNQPLSSRHHYIPQYYIKGFTNSNNCVFLLKKKIDKIDVNEISPKSIFYERNRNIVIYYDERTDLVEKCYSDFDNIFARLFEKIKIGITEEDLFTKDGIKLFKQFISIMLFRLPLMDKYLNFVIDNYDLKKTRNHIKVGDVNIFDIQEFKEKINTDKSFRYYFRCFILPLLFFNIFSEKEESGRWYMFDTGKMWEKHLCSDSPIIVDDMFKLFSFEAQLILPITKRKLIVFSKNRNLKPEEIDESFVAKVDALQIGKADKYVCGPDRDYLENINNCYKEYWGEQRIVDLYREVLDYIK